nr:protein TAP1-like [Ipomoea batatas]
MLKLIAAAAVAWMIVLPAPPTASANFAKLGCIAMCLRECRVAGVAAPACLKFCPVHCDNPPIPTRPVFHCTLDCLNQCVSNQSSRNNNVDRCAIAHSEIGFWVLKIIQFSCPLDFRLDFRTGPADWIDR